MEYLKIIRQDRGNKIRDTLNVHITLRLKMERAYQRVGFGRPGLVARVLPYNPDPELTPLWLKNRNISRHVLDTPHPLLDHAQHHFTIKVAWLSGLTRCY